MKETITLPTGWKIIIDAYGYAHSFDNHGRVVGSQEMITYLMQNNLIKEQ